MDFERDLFDPGEPGERIVRMRSGFAGKRSSWIPGCIRRIICSGNTFSERNGTGTRPWNLDTLSGISKCSARRAEEVTPDPIKKQLSDLDTKLSKLTALFFGDHLTTMKYLKDKGIADEKEFAGYLAEAKKEFKQLDDDVDFWKMMKDFKGKGE